MLPKILGWWWGQREEFIIIICYFPVRQRFRSLFAWSGDKRKPLLTAAWSSIYIIHPIALTHAYCASWHVGQHIRYHVCSGPASEWPSRCDGGSWTPLLQFDTRCSWVTLVSASPLVSSEGLCERCCRSISIAFTWWHLVVILSWLQWVRICWLEMVFGQNICRILLRFFVWKVVSLLRLLSVILLHSELYSKVESMHIWYSLLGAVPGWLLHIV